MRYFLTFVWLLVSGPLFAAGPEIRLVQTKRQATIEVAGLSREQLAALAGLAPDDERWQRTFSLHVAGSEVVEGLAMAGSYKIDGELLRFTPQFRLNPGVNYAAVLYPPALSTTESPARYEQAISIPAPPRGEPAKVTAVYPSASVLPENQLRFYLHFSAPMSRGEAYTHIRLLKDDGAPVVLPFLEIGEELWDASGTRLTLLADPGRIKRGLKPREEDGPVLEAGRGYTLVVDRAWPDATGQPLAETYKKAFKAGPPIEKALDTKDWKVHSPRAGTKSALALAFPHPLDRALLERTITVTGPNGKLLGGDVAVGKEERSWQFKPDQPWVAGKYELVIDTTLEDGAGNRIGRPFEVDQFDAVDKTTNPEFFRLPFEAK